MQRWVILVSAVVLQMCLGATYSWSIYVQPLRDLTGLLQGTAQAPFTIFYFTFPATMIVSGGLLPRLGPRRSAVLGGILFGGGWLLAGAGTVHFAFTAAGIGAVAGVGVGFAYIVPIATCIRWFPRHKGLVTGTAVAGFGGGAALVSQAGGWLMSEHGFTPFETFTAFGAAFLVLTVGAGLTMENPPDAGARPAPSHARPPSRVGSDPVFRILYLAMFTGLAAGFTVNANIRDLYRNGSLEAGIRAVALFAVANAAGRIGWGFLFDRMRSAAAVTANLLCQAAVLFCAPLLLRSDLGLQGFALLTGFNYGGVLVVYVSSVARRWGGDMVGQVYGWLFSANIPAAFAPMAAGFAFDRTGSFTAPLLAVAGLLTAGALLAGFRLRRHGTPSP